MSQSVFGHVGVVFWILVYVWVASEMFVTVRARRLGRRGAGRPRRDRGSAYLIGGGMYLLIVVSLIFSLHGWGALPAGAALAGYALMVMGMAVRLTAIAQLGRFFSPRLGVSADQILVREGLYAHIRHPSYTGGWLTVLGIGLALRTWWGAVLCGVGLWLTYTYRIHVEEEMLCEHFGAEYEAYRRSTKRMFPGIW